MHKTKKFFQMIIQAFTSFLIAIRMFFGVDTQLHLHVVMILRKTSKLQKQARNHPSKSYS